MKIYTATEIKQVESHAFEHESIQPIDLMERAASTICEEIKSKWGTETSIKVFAGSHNNGGDALAVSRMLAQCGYNLEVFLFNTNGHLTPECEINRDRLVATCPQVTFHEISTKIDLPKITKDDLIIDGLFGVGLNGSINGSYTLLIKFLNNSEGTIISIDIPSGMHCEDNSQTLSHQIVHADYTFSLHAVKPAFLLADCQQYIGKCKILDIGLENNTHPDIKTRYTLDEEDEMRELIKPRNPFGNKGTFGHGLLIAGSYGMAGAAIIAAQATLKSGIGKLTIHTPAANNTILQTSVPQAVIHHDEDNYVFTTAEYGEEYQAVAIGPGIGQKKETAVALMEQITHTLKPLVIDADGLNILSNHKGWMQQLPKNSILTPHPKELSRLFGETTSDYGMLCIAREEAQRLQIFIICKNHYTAICCPDGHIYFNTTGNSGMATAGTGDALTGILLSLLSQGYTARDACRLGCYIHGLAGDIAAEKLTEEGMTVMDLINEIPSAIKELKNSAYLYANTKH